MRTQFRSHFVITSEMFSFEVILQWAEEMKVVRLKVRAVWWMGKVFPAKLLQEVRCDAGRVGQKSVAFSAAPYPVAVPVCGHCCSAVQ